MDEAADRREDAGLSDVVSNAWVDFLARNFTGDRTEAIRPRDVRRLHAADSYLRSLAQDPSRYRLDEVVRDSRAIVEHPVRTAYPLLFPSDPPRAERGATYRTGELTYGVHVQAGKQRVFIANQLAELVSADVHESGVDPWTITALGLRPHEFLFLSPHDIANARTVLTSEQFLAAGRLRRAELHRDLTPALRSSVQLLAELPLFLAALSTNGCGPEGFISWFVPNLAYEECCNAHDVCYAKGGTEADRARCDEQLARCIEAIGGGGLAPGGFGAGFVSFLYYTFVTVFGFGAFTYGPGAGGSTPAHKTSQGQGGGVKCGWTVRFVDVIVRGADDDTFEFEVIPDLEKQTQTNPGSLRRLKFPETKVEKDARVRFSSDPISVQFGQSDCGDEVTVTIFANARKHRRFRPDLVVGDEKSKTFVCDGSSYDFSIELAVDPATVTFNFIIETVCA